MVKDNLVLVNGKEHISDYGTLKKDGNVDFSFLDISRVL